MGKCYEIIFHSLGEKNVWKKNKGVELLAAMYNSPDWKVLIEEIFLNSEIIRLELSCVLPLNFLVRFQNSLETGPYPLLFPYIIGMVLYNEKLYSWDTKLAMVALESLHRSLGAIWLGMRATSLTPGYI